MQLEHKHQPLGSTHSPQPSPALAASPLRWVLHSTQLLEGSSTPKGGQGIALQASHCGTVSLLSTMLLASRVEHGASILCPLSPTALS